MPDYVRYCVTCNTAEKLRAQGSGTSSKGVPKSYLMGYNETLSDFNHCIMNFSS